MNEESRQRWRDLKRAELAASTADAADRVKIQAALAADALKALLVANGGAMIALFSFVGNVLSKAPSVRFELHNLRWAFGMFVAGFAIGLVAHVFAFLSQDRFFQQAAAEMQRMANELRKDDAIFDQIKEFAAFRHGNIAYVVGLVLAVLSVALFCGGCWFALSGVLL